LRIRKENILVVIPARGGSKGIHMKNIKPLHNKPLLQYTIELALKLFNKNQIVVSTENDLIRKVAEKCGIEVPELRPEHLAQDNSSTYDVLIDIITRLKPKDNPYQYLLLLQPTSPFRLTKHIKQAIELYDDSLDMIVGVKETKSNPYYNLFEENENEFLSLSKPKEIVGRQYAPKVYEYNGAIYLMSISSLKKQPISKFKKVKKMVMGKYHSLDIDDEIDWKMAELILKNRLIELN
jgi:N-acylneuraminate cytidylyltransferase